MKRPSDPSPADFRPDRLLLSSRYQALLGAPQSWQRQGTLRQVRQQLRSCTPRGAGVYALLDSENQLIYVGMSKRLAARLTCYFSSEDRRRKERRIGKRARVIVWQAAAHPLIAALRERELIQTYRPQFNVQGQPSRIVWGAVVLSDLQAPHFQLQREVPKRHRGVWGPVPITPRMKLAVEQINLHFQLRDCPATTPMHFQQTKSRSSPEAAATVGSGCLRVDLRTCLAPCVGSCSERRYLASVTAAKQFFNGHPEACLEEIGVSMQQAAAARQFERAAQFRDRKELFARLAEHLERFHAWTRRANFLYRVQSELDGRPWWFSFQAGVLVDAVPVPQSPEERTAVRQRLEHAKKNLVQNGGQRPLTSTHEFTAARILHRWFRLNPTEREQLSTFSAGLRMCRVRSGRPSRKKPQ